MMAKIHRTVTIAATWADIASSLLAAVRRVIEALPTRSEKS